MSVSSIWGTRVVMGAPWTAVPGLEKNRRGEGLMIVCSSRPKKKATAHHVKTRPRKTQPWDIKRKPTVYPPLPPLPPDYSLVIPADPPPQDATLTASA